MRRLKMDSHIVTPINLEDGRKRQKGDEDQQMPMQIAPQDVLDMPVDPNEPTYCLCHQVSYGEMIGCDNPDVSKLWAKSNKIQIINNIGVAVRVIKPTAICFFVSFLGSCVHFLK